MPVDIFRVVPGKISINNKVSVFMMSRKNGMMEYWKNGMK